MAVIDFKTRRKAKDDSLSWEAIKWAIRQATGPGKLQATTSKAQADEAAFALTILTGRTHRVEEERGLYHILD